jgi:hypothetical protein
MMEDLAGSTWHTFAYFILFFVGCVQQKIDAYLVHIRLY